MENARHYTHPSKCRWSWALLQSTQSTRTQGRWGDLAVTTLLTAVWGSWWEGGFGWQRKQPFRSRWGRWKEPCDRTGGSGRRRKLLESSIWGDRQGIPHRSSLWQTDMGAPGRPRWCSPSHISHPEVLVCESNSCSCTNTDADVVPIYMFFENNAF